MTTAPAPPLPASPPPVPVPARPVSAPVHPDSYKRLFDLSGDLLCVASTDGWFLELNGSWERTLGGSRDELMARPYVEFVHEDDRGATGGAMARLASGQPVFRFENRYRARDGGIRWLAWTSSPAEDARTVFAVARDVTEERLQRDELAARDRTLQALSDHLPCVIARYGPDLRLLYANRRLEEATGFALGDLVGRRTGDLAVTPDRATAWEDLLRGVFATGTPVSHSFTYDVGGRRQAYEATIVPETTADGRVASVISTTRDVTARVHAETQLRLLGAAVDTAIDAVVIAEDTGDDALPRIVYANCVWGEDGYTREELYGQPPTRPTGSVVARSGDFREDGDGADRP